MPDIGYPDFQRVVNWDSPVLYADSVDNVTTYKQSGALDVSRYAYMGGFASITAGYCLVTLEWFLDQSMSTIVGERQFTLDQSISEICQPKIPHMGPFLQVTFEAIASNPFSGSWSLFATNRAYPLEFVPINPVVFDVQGVDVGAISSSSWYPSNYYAGPALLSMYSTEASCQSGIQRLTSAGSWEFIYNLDLPAGSQWNQWRIVLPSGAWRCVYTNNSASTATMYGTITHSTTGST